jgi:predicted RNase H-like HicB family nuclease
MVRRVPSVLMLGRAVPGGDGYKPSNVSFDRRGRSQKSSMVVFSPRLAASWETSTMRMIVTLARDETGRIVAECPAIPGCVSQGQNEAEAIRNIQETIRGCLESRAAHGIPLTVAIQEVQVSL